MKNLVIAAGLCAACTHMTLAQISTVGPFTGPYTESFETQTANFVPCVPGRIFASTADLCTPSGSSTLITQFWSMFCVVSPHSGTFMAGSNYGPCQITFDSPVRRFGGYFATITNSPGGTVDFFDAQGGNVGSTTLSTNACDWMWNGWESQQAFSQVLITGTWSLGAGAMVQLDDLEYQSGTACYANCDASTSPPILNANDFQCFLNKFAAGDSYANCDQSTAPPILNANDFQCFLNAFAVGCN